MASNPFNALMDPAQLGQSIQGAFQMGQQQRQQYETQKAIGDYVTNQTPESAKNVARYNPAVGMQLMDREQQRQAQLQQQQKADQERKIIGDAINGNPQARQMLAYTNADFYLKLDDRSKKMVDQTMGAIAQQAFSILQMPKDQQGPALQQALAALQAQGIDTSQFALTGDPEADLKAALAMAGKLDQWEQFSQPKYTPIGEAGLAGFQFGVPIQQGGQPQNFAQPQQAQQQEPQQDITGILRNATANRIITPEEAQAVQSNLGPNGQAAFQGWLQQNGVSIGKQVGGQTYYLVNGKWYDNPEGR